MGMRLKVCRREKAGNEVGMRLKRKYNNEKKFDEKNLK